jgi:hypothetical protein
MEESVFEFYRVLTPLYTQSASYCSIEGRIQTAQRPRDHCTKGVDACGSIGSALNEMLPRSPDWLHGESMVAEFQHSNHRWKSEISLHSAIRSRRKEPHDPITDMAKQRDAHKSADP